MAEVTYTYVLVRQDLPHNVQLVQVGHAAFTMGTQCKEHLNLIVLSVKDQIALMKAQVHLDMEGVNHHMFYEPDLDEYTAICTAPLSLEGKKLMRRYELVKA